MPVAPTLKQNISRVLYGLSFVALALIGLQLFMPDQIAFLVNLFASPQQQIHASGEKLVIAYAFKPASLDPTQFDPISRSYLNDVYQGLVTTDRGLKIEPAIAVSWGLIDPTTWEFRLRPGVKFHNGQTLAANDVISSILRARDFETSQLRSLLGTIKSVEVSGNDRIRIKTLVPDPLLLTKLSVTYIFPASLTDFSKPVGTGPYVFASENGDSVTLQAFKDYWGNKPFFQRVVLRAISDRSDRIAALENGEVHLLANLPPVAGCNTDSRFEDMAACSRIRNPDVVIKSVPSLEVAFIALNRKSQLFRSQTIREAMSGAFDRQVFVDTAYGFARPANQFVSSGVFGFNPELPAPTYDSGSARQLVDESLSAVFELPKVTFDYPESLSSVGDYVKNQLSSLGIDVSLNPLSDAALIEKISSGDSDFYYLGWRSELGDALDFLKAVAHSYNPISGFGQFNGIRYVNKKVDQLIEKSVKNLDPESRLKDMQEVMRILVEEDPYGIPLFESDTIFAFNKKINFEPRVDGYIYPSEIK